MIFPNKVNIFMGMFGSGKTEIALNVAEKLAKSGEKVVLADIDTISMYFRSRDLREEFQKLGIKIIAPRGVLARADLPIISPEIFGYLDNPEYKMIMDVGGNDDGAVVLSSLSGRISNSKYTMYYVLNRHRPFNDTPEKSIAHIKRLEEKSRLKINFLVNNTNLGPQTTPELVEKGERFIEKISETVSIPVAFTVVMAGLKVKKGLYPQLRIKKYMKTPWEEGE